MDYFTRRIDFSSKGKLAGQKHRAAVLLNPRRTSVDIGQNTPTMTRLFAILKAISTTAERISPEACWFWPGDIDRDGYGVIWMKGKPYKASWVSYRFYRNRPSSGMVVMHSCDNPACWNPQHLFLGTRRRNMEDMAAKGRGAWQTGAEDRRKTSVWPPRGAIVARNSRGVIATLSRKRPNI